ncbi:MAG: hypothetical protein CBD82_00215 [Gammaproteobacteria bacterium TMED222]|jgi:hypothetical protein|nr:MAG: hypothetical protein CBD82_00215 [Gammaproteobacteria bacterium TMED222]|tara:strand:- start:562 stop:846 length:285 start_codon:yes stop_codon:yes gene_type:complete
MDLHKGIRAIHSSVVSILGETEKNIVALDKDEKKVNIDWTKVNAWADSEAYKAKREQEYPSIQDQLDMQYHDLINDTTTWKDAIKSVKVKYPKK